MKVMEIRDHSSAAPKKSKARKIIAVGLGLTLSFCVGAYIGHTAGQEVKTVERQQIHYVQEGETLWDIAAGISGDDQDIRKVIYDLAKLNDIAPDADLKVGQKIVIAK